MGILEDIAGALGDIKRLWDRISSVEAWVSWLSGRVDTKIDELWGFLDERLGDLDEKIIAVLHVKFDEFTGDLWSVLDTVRRDIKNARDTLANLAGSYKALQKAVDALPGVIVGQAMDYMVLHWEALVDRILALEVPEPISMHSVFDKSEQDRYKKLREERQYVKR